jgi:hypothetical protein
MSSRIIACGCQSGAWMYITETRLSLTAHKSFHFIHIYIYRLSLIFVWCMILLISSLIIACGCQSGAWMYITETRLSFTTHKSFHSIYIYIYRLSLIFVWCMILLMSSLIIACGCQSGAWMYITETRLSFTGHKSFHSIHIYIDSPSYSFGV